MKFLNFHSTINKLEESVQNSFKWEWLERRDSNNDMRNTWCKKIDSADEAYCVFYNSMVMHEEEGFKVFQTMQRQFTSKI